MTAFEYLGKLAVDEHGRIEHLRFYRSGSLFAARYTYRNQYGRDYEETLIEDQGIAYLCTAPYSAEAQVRLEQDPVQLFLLPRERVLPW